MRKYDAERAVIEIIKFWERRMEILKESMDFCQKTMNLEELDSVDIERIDEMYKQDKDAFLHAKRRLSDANDLYLYYEKQRLMEAEKKEK